MGEFAHVPVLAAEVLRALSPADGGVYIDGTLGGAGHSSLILEHSAPTGFLLGIDRDDDALRAAGRRLAPYAGRFCLVKGNFADSTRNVETIGFVVVDVAVAGFVVEAGSVFVVVAGFVVVVVAAFAPAAGMTSVWPTRSVAFGSTLFAAMRSASFTW